MKLTIIPVDGNVKKDGIGYLELDLSSCAIPSNVRVLQWQETSGWLEFWDKQNENITELPSWVNCCLNVWQVSYDKDHQPPPTPTAEENKDTARSKLFTTDWTTIPDVSDPTKSNPYLSNANDFVTYRNAVRQYALNPVAGDITWPTLPQEVWTPV